MSTDRKNSREAHVCKALAVDGPRPAASTVAMLDIPTDEKAVLMALVLDSWDKDAYRVTAAPARCCLRLWSGLNRSNDRFVKARNGLRSRGLLDWDENSGGAGNTTEYRVNLSGSQTPSQPGPAPEPVENLSENLSGSQTPPSLSPLEEEEGADALHGGFASKDPYPADLDAAFAYIGVDQKNEEQVRKAVNALRWRRAGGRSASYEGVPEAKPQAKNWGEIRSSLTTILRKNVTTIAHGSAMQRAKHIDMLDALRDDVTKVTDDWRQSVASGLGVRLSDALISSGRKDPERWRLTERDAEALRRYMRPLIDPLRFGEHPEEPPLSEVEAYLDAQAEARLEEDHDKEHAHAEEAADVR